MANSLDGNNFDGSALADDQIVNSSSHTTILEKALTTYIANAESTLIQQETNEDNTESPNPLNTLSRVTIAAAKFPNDSNISNYGEFQIWMYNNTNKRSVIDVCQSLNRMLLIHIDPFDYSKLFNLLLITTEAYQTVGDIDQAYCQYYKVEILAKEMSNMLTALNGNNNIEWEIQQKKLKDIEMKLQFQSQFKVNLIQSRNQNIFYSNGADFLEKLSMHSPSPEQCRYIWRQIVLQVVLNPNLAVPSAQWLLLYADRFPHSSLQHANSLYVALNMHLYAYGSKLLRESVNINVFKLLDDIGRFFEENGDQSRQFSPIHKMAHVWGTAAIVFHLTSDYYKYIVCACIMRASFELLGIRFLSSGIESLYILALKHAPDFFNMMAYDPSIKLTSPDCLNYFRRQLEHQSVCIRYSTETVDRYVIEVFNIDQTSC